MHKRNTYDLLPVSVVREIRDQYQFNLPNKFITDKTLENI